MIRYSIALFLIVLSVNLLYAGDMPRLVLEQKSPVIRPEVRSFLQKHPDEKMIPVWITFTDKGIQTKKEFVAAVEAFRNQLSPRSLQRRAKTMHDALITFEDLPVYKEYVQRLQTLGFRKRHVSRWLNAVSGFIDRGTLEEISSLSFVREVKLLHRSHRPVPKQSPDEINAPTDSTLFQYGPSQGQLEQIHVPELHQMGYSGKGVLICMLDTGYNLHHEALQHIHPMAEYDFIFHDDTTRNQAGKDIASQHNHGTETLSVIGGKKRGQLYGPAYGAQFILAKTEDIRSETPIEEDNWVAAIEWADSIGVDVASSSLGYLDWYTYEDMDGNTAVTTRAADMAVARGIVVVVAAGNWRNDPWHYISAPADADSVISVGAVDINGHITSFSSAGPTYDGRTKPEVVALGSNVYAAHPNDSTAYIRVAGTSFSTPLTAGVTALLLQAHPTWTPMQVREALMMTADRADHPDNLYGWGLVNALAALQYHQKGDVDGNDQYNLKDVELAARIAIDAAAYGINEFRAADMNGDGKVNILDVILLFRFVSSN